MASIWPSGRAKSMPPKSASLSFRAVLMSAMRLAHEENTRPCVKKKHPTANLYVKGLYFSFSIKQCRSRRPFHPFFNIFIAIGEKIRADYERKKHRARIFPKRINIHFKLTPERFNSKSRQAFFLIFRHYSLKLPKQPHTSYSIMGLCGKSGISRSTSKIVEWEKKKRAKRIKNVLQCPMC